MQLGRNLCAINGGVSLINRIKGIVSSRIKRYYDCLSERVIVDIYHYDTSCMYLYEEYTGEGF